MSYDHDAEMQGLYKRTAGRNARVRFLTIDQKEMLVDWLAAQGRKAKQSGKPKSSCPYPDSEIMGRTGWLAGYGDAERGMA